MSEHVVWPEKLALVRSENQTAFTLKHVKGTQEKGVVEIKPMPVPQGFLALDTTYTCSVTDSHYLAGVHVRPLGGRSLPKGSLKVVADGEEVFRGPLGSFLPDPDPFDCLKVRGWKKTSDVYTAHRIMDGRAVQDLQIGYMMINGSKVLVYLSKVEAEEAVPLEITLLSALYTTLKDAAP